jgi:hypothetical protein
MTADHIIENITAQMIRDTAGWSQSEHDLRDTLRLAAVALEAAEAERDALRKALQPFAAAAENLDEDHRDNSPIWETPAAMGIDAVHLRRARTLAGDNHE